MIWWRVDPALSRQLSLARYLGALLFAALAIPLASFLLGALLANFNPKPPNPLVYLSTITFLGSLSILIAGAFLLLSVPLFIIARRTGYIGLIPTLIAAVLMPTLKITYEFLREDTLPQGEQMAGILAILAGFACLYAVTVWVTCLKLHPGLFTRQPPQTPTAGP